MKVKEVFFVLLLNFCLACTPHKDLEEYNINSLLVEQVQLSKTLNKPVVLSLCNQLPFKWDNIIILGPYSNDTVLDRYNLVNASAISKKLPVLALDETACILLFVENKMIVRYCIVPRELVDFNDFKPKKEGQFIIAKKEACEQIVIKSAYGKFIPSF